jgi:hypothetical protein
MHICGRCACGFATLGHRRWSTHYQTAFDEGRLWSVPAQEHTHSVQTILFARQVARRTQIYQTSAPSGAFEMLALHERHNLNNVNALILPRPRQQTHGVTSLTHGMETLTFPPRLYRK